MRTIDNIIIHCTATSQKATVAGIVRYWKEVKKWKVGGYHKLVLPTGEVVTLYSDDVVTNGVALHNSNSLHVSYIGGIDDKGKPLDNRTPQQKESLVGIVKDWKKKYPTAKVKGHNDFSSKACPSFKVKEGDFI